MAMEAQRRNLSSFFRYPIERWKFGAQSNIFPQMWCTKRLFLYTKSMFLFHMFILCCCSNNNIINLVSAQSWDGIIITQSDYNALEALKQDFVDPQGVLRSWNDSGASACSGSWFGIKCSKGQVIVIKLPKRGLGGRLSEKIGQFQALRKLSLHDNVIGGPIPNSLGFLPDLRGVQLFNNLFSGSVPPELGLCRVLQTLDLSNNSLSGEIPESLGGLTKLFMLNLSYNSLSGEIPMTLTRSKSIVFLVLSSNNLSGSITGLVEMSEVQEVSLDHNRLSGVIPNNIDRLTRLSVLSLSYNMFVGDVPATIGDVSALRHLDLSHNSLSGEIPEALSDLPRIDVFDVSYNNLSGRVPTRLAQEFNSSSFMGNFRLCGYTGSNPCPAKSPSSPSETVQRSCRKRGIKNIILIAAGVLLVLLFVICCVLICFLIKKRPVEEGEIEKGVEAEGETIGKLVHFEGVIKSFTADDLLCATADVLGKSTYGTVYKATLRDNNRVAVKRLRERFTVWEKEFESEVCVLGKIRHPNVLPLRAYYLGPKGEKLLVFDYMPKGNLANRLHAQGGDGSTHTPMDWPTRLRIAKGIARGLAHLHDEAKIIHGNLTSSNVLLDSNSNPKISDYGLYRVMTEAANANAISTSGALGYRAPELTRLKRANRKTDVHSLGVIVLELLTGKFPRNDDVDLPRWVSSMAKEESGRRVFDSVLMSDDSIVSDELLNTLRLALHCVHPSPSARPEALQVLQRLEEIRNV